MNGTKHERTSRASEVAGDFAVAVRIMIIDGDPFSAARLGGALSRLRSHTAWPLDNATAKSIKEADKLMDRLRPNVIFIDITSAGPSPNVSSEFVLDIRMRRKGIVFVLYSEQKELERQCSTFPWWKERLMNYYRLNKGGTDDEFDDALDRALEKVELDLQLVGAIQTLENSIGGIEPLLTLKQIEKIYKQLDPLTYKLKTLIGSTA